MQKVLVISNKWDSHADAVIRAMQHIGLEVVRINTEDFRQNSVDIRIGNSTKEWQVVTPEGRLVDSSSIGGVYIRRLSMPIDVYDVNEKYHAFARKEALAVLESLSVLLGDVAWLNRPMERLRASNKIAQLFLADSVGLIVPETVITNVPESAVAFFSTRKVDTIYKTLSCPMLDLGNESHSMINTTILPSDADFSSVRLTPALFQQYVDKEYELRIHIIDDVTISVRIDSQDFEGARIDWRKAPRDIAYSLVDLPRDVQTKLHLLMRKLNIRFGIVDMIKTRTGDYVFLEINPDGNWLWIEQLIQVPISESIALFFRNNIGEQS